MKGIILRILSILLGLLLLNGGLNKIFQYIEPHEMSEGAMALMGAFMESGWIFPLVAIVEITAGVLFMLPRTRALAATMFFPISIGIVLFHVYQEPSGLIIALIVFFLNIWFLAEDKAKLKSLF
ncbi:MAG: putative oxidoreductase [Sphingobacteriales bacterium]|jgi:putative oxidoreductase